MRAHEHAGERNVIGRFWQGLDDWTWGKRPETLPRAKRWSVLAARLVHVLVRDVRDGQITMRAMGLVYTSLLSLAPMLAIAFSMLKAFGIHDLMRPTLIRFLAPLGADASRVVDTVMGFVDNMKVGVLGTVGVALLLYAVISLIQKVEAACNYVWQVRRPRSVGRRFSEYLSVLIVGPLLIVSAGSMTASVTSNTLVQQIAAIEPFGTTLLLAGKLMPYFLWSAGFTFLFMFMPNTRVQFVPALVGGLLSGVLWQTASVAFATFASTGGNYNAIYASFAILIFLLIWLYLSWLIMLLGCRVAFLLQHPEQLRRGAYPPRAGAAREESLAMLIMGLVGHAYVNNAPPWSVEQLTSHLRAVPAHVHDLVDRLTAAGILVETNDNGGGNTVVPRRDIDTLGVDELLTVVRSGAPEAEPHPREDGPYERATALLARIDTARREAVAGATVRDLAENAQAPDQPQRVAAG